MPARMIRRRSLTRLKIIEFMRGKFSQNFPLQIKDITRQIKKAVVAGSLRELQRKSAEKFHRIECPKIHLDSDGTEIDDEDYFQTLESNTELICVFNNEQWIDVSEKTQK